MTSYSVNINVVTKGVQYEADLCYCFNTLDEAFQMIKILELSSQNESDISYTIHSY